jgi:hypothetical protein
VTAALDIAAAAKPPHGAPCNGCGGCFQFILCPLGAAVFRRRRGPCPAHDSGCGLVAAPERFAPPLLLIAHDRAALSAAAAHLIGAGVGCDALLEGDRPSEAFYARMRDLSRRSHARTRRALRTWGLA